MIEKMNLQSQDIAAQKRNDLKELFPSVFIEARNERGNLVEGIDFEKLRAELGEFSEVLESRRERYGLDWPGKKDCVKLIQHPSIGALKPRKNLSLEFETAENLFIEGDNLEVLKLLQKSYYGRVKMIYVDPPYNTGNEFIYPDKYAESLDTYLQYSGQADSSGKKFSTNSANEGRFHTKWLNMMYPRLYLARNLLSSDGAIFLSIDDNEVRNLRAICDEIFGEENFLAQFVWKCRQFTDSRAKTQVSTDHEYVLAYAKSQETVFRGQPRDESKYKNPDGDERGPWMSRSMLGLATADQRPNLHYPITNPATGQVFEPPDTTGWRYSRERMESMISEGRVLFPNSATGRPREKKFRAELESQFTSFPTVIDDVHTSHGTASIRSLFEGSQVFDFPKPPELLQKFVEQIVGENEICMDLFAGSCATAHAVVEQGTADGLKRRFIMVQLPEPVDEKTQAAKSGLSTITELGRQRILRAISSVRERDDGLFTNNQLSLGFRFFSLGHSAFKIWPNASSDTPDAEIERQLELNINHISPEATKDEILYELLLKAGFELSVPIESITLAGFEVSSVGDGSLLICLEDEVTHQLINKVVDLNPIQFICLDAAFSGNDQLKANAVQTFASANQGRHKADEIVFRTV